MAAFNDCIRAIDAAAAGDLSEDQIAEIVEALDRIRAERKAAGKLDGLEEALFDEAGRIAEDAALAAKIEKRNRLINISVRGRVMRMARDARARFGDASLALEAVMVGINTPLEGGRLSIDARGQTILRGYLGGMVADLREADALGQFARGDMDRDIARELWNLSQRHPQGQVTGSAKARKVAEIIHRYQQAAVKRENRAGAHIRFRQGYITRQTHDRARMERAGKEAWARDVAGKLDWDTMEIAPPDRAKFLDSAWEALVTGVRKNAAGAEENDLLFAFKGPGNLAKKDSASRVLLFKDADSWFDYNEKFGRSNLREAIMDDLRRTAQNTAIMEGLGTNPRAMFEQLRDDLKKQYRSDPEQVRRLDRPQLNWFMAEIDGSVNFANNHTLAGVGRTVRAVQSMAKLGGAFISSIADLAAAATERRFQGRSLADSWLDGFMAPIEGLTAGEARVYADRVGVGIDSMLGDVVSRFAAQDDAPGRVNKMMSLFFKLNLLGPWTDGVKRGVGMMMARDLADTASRPFAQLAEPQRRLLGQYGVDAKLWEVARQAVVEAPDGRTYLLPGEIENVSGRVFTGLSKLQQQKLKDRAREAISTFITDRVEFASPTPGARERAYMRFGLQPGTGAGEAVRFMMQFKAFPVTMNSRVLGREIFGRSRGAQTIASAFMKGEADFLGIANLIAGGTVLGYIALQAKEIAKGREAREPSASLLIGSMLQGGGLGIYGDFLLGETNRFGRSLTDTLVGPTAGTIADLDEIRAKAMAGEDVGASLIRVMKANIPGANLFYTKAALDYMVWYQLQEMANPGYLRRMERRIERENNQRFFLPPSEVVR